MSAPYRKDTESQRRPQLVAVMLGADVRVPMTTKDLLGLTEHKLVPRQLPGGVIRQLHRVHVDVLMAIGAHRLDHLPSDLIAWLLQDKTDR